MIRPLISEVSNQNSESYHVIRAGTAGESSSCDRSSLPRQRGPNCHPTTVRTKWPKNVNKIVMECLFRIKPVDNDLKPIKGYRQLSMQEWKEHKVFEITEQRLCDQARDIKKKG